MKAQTIICLLLLYSLCATAQVDDLEIQRNQARIADEIKKLSSPPQTRLFLYALEPDQMIYLKPFHGASVLGSKEITSPQEKNELLEAFANDVSRGGGGSLCFNPRHALRVQSGSVTTDFVICFECGYVRSDSFPSEMTVFVSSLSEKVFNRYVDKYHLKHRWKWYWANALFIGVVVLTWWFRRKKLVPSIAAE